MFFYNPTFILLIPALILALYAQAKVSSTFAKYFARRGQHVQDRRRRGEGAS